MIPSGQHGLLVGGACGVFSILDQVRKSGNMSLMQYNLLQYDGPFSYEFILPQRKITVEGLVTHMTFVARILTFPRWLFVVTPLECLQLKFSIFNQSRTLQDSANSNVQI